MLNDPAVKALILLGEEMLAAGVKELKDTPADENPLETVGRIYMVMEVTRIMIEHVMEHEAADNKVLH